MKHFYLQYETKLIVILLTTFLIAGCTSNFPIRIQNLTCENLHEPLGINSLQPHFSWINISEKQNKHQTAYQLIVEIGRAHV